MVVSSVDAVSVEKALLDELLEEDTRKSVIDTVLIVALSHGLITRSFHFGYAREWSYT
jgi:hypothetical protein